jgi:hypothetical protein
VIHVLQKALEQQEAQWADRLEVSQQALRDALEQQDAQWAEQLEASQAMPATLAHLQSPAHHLTNEAAGKCGRMAPSPFPSPILFRAASDDRGVPAALPKALQHRRIKRGGHWAEMMCVPVEHADSLQALLEEAEAELSTAELASASGRKAAEIEAGAVAVAGGAPGSASIGRDIETGLQDAAGAQVKGAQLTTGSAELLAMAEAASEVQVEEAHRAASTCVSTSVELERLDETLAAGGHGVLPGSPGLDVLLALGQATCPPGYTEPCSNDACSQQTPEATQHPSLPPQKTSSPCMKLGQASYPPNKREVLSPLRMLPNLLQSPQPATSPLPRSAASPSLLCNDVSPLRLRADAMSTASPSRVCSAETSHTASSTLPVHTSSLASPCRVHSAQTSHDAASMTPASTASAEASVTRRAETVSREIESPVDIACLRSPKHLMGRELAALHIVTVNADASLPCHRRLSQLPLDHANMRETENTASAISCSGERSSPVASDQANPHIFLDESLSYVSPGCSRAFQRSAAARLTATAHAFTSEPPAVCTEGNVSVCRHDRGHKRGREAAGTAARYADTAPSEASSPMEGSAGPLALAVRSLAPARLRLALSERETAIGDTVLDQGLESLRALRAAQPQAIVPHAAALQPSEHGGHPLQKHRSSEVRDEPKAHSSLKIRQAEGTDVRVALDMLRQSHDAEACREVGSGQAVVKVLLGHRDAAPLAPAGTYGHGGDENAGPGALNCATLPTLSSQNLVPAASGKALHSGGPSSFAVALSRSLSEPECLKAQHAVNTQCQGMQLAVNAAAAPTLSLPAPLIGTSADWSAPLSRALEAARRETPAAGPNDFGFGPPSAPWIARLSSSAQALRRHTARVLNAHATSMPPPFPGSALDRVRAAAAAATPLPLRAAPIQRPQGFASEVSSASGSSCTASVHESTSLARAAAVVAGACRRRRHRPALASGTGTGGRVLMGQSSNFLHSSALSRKHSEVQELQARERAREAATASTLESILHTL